MSAELCTSGHTLLYAAILIVFGESLIAFTSGEGTVTLLVTAVYSTCRHILISLLNSKQPIFYLYKLRNMKLPWTVNKVRFCLSSVYVLTLIFEPLTTHTNVTVSIAIVVWKKRPVLFFYHWVPSKLVYLYILYAFGMTRPGIKPESGFQVPPLIKKEKLRVLSLCDGIATTRLALEALGLDIGAYFACEIDNDAKYVVNFSQGRKVINIGDVYNVNQDVVSFGWILTQIFGGLLSVNKQQCLHACSIKLNI